MQNVFENRESNMRKLPNGPEVLADFFFMLDFWTRYLFYDVNINHTQFGQLLIWKLIDYMNYGYRQIARLFMSSQFGN